MKLLLDQNISRKLVSKLADPYPDSTPVALIDLERASDVEIWEYALERGYVLVSKDTDFCEMAILKDFPPKVVWIRRGNCTTSAIESILKEGQETVEKLVSSLDSGILILE